MPSGHTNFVFYSSIFIYLSLKNVNIFICYILFSLLVAYHRIYFNHHFFIQTIVGAVVGLLFGFFMYYMATQKIMGKISKKIDDFADVL
jgi:membrane-associated phospholipid phosphatase